ncbi:polysaccharide deacetylase family protein [Kiloniella majae]|uniref:polysaccharide deacetylase family protein n=1 Tax=Kiloniella majae TaxID=1938558 RepID=UPI000A277283|nr:polysaccharide deacetylase family protein [Kiloniella majae]
MLQTIRRVLSALRSKLFGSKEQTLAKQIFVSYSEKCRAAGIDRLYFVISFDCDTPEDAQASKRLSPYLMDKGIIPTFAVPGAQLAEGAVIYRDLYQNGAHFMNHGGQPHAVRRGPRYFSVTDYATFTDEQVIADIREGHRINVDVLGASPTGFRAPHFGSYQKPEQLDVIYRTARDLGYSYCSTTLPPIAYEGGATIKREGGLYEFPLIGSVRSPQVILDSWNYLSDVEKLILKDDFFVLFKETVDYFLDNNLPGVLNYYVDPAHVVDNPPFYKAIDYIAEKGIPSLSFPQLIDLAEGRAKGPSAT